MPNMTRSAVALLAMVCAACRGGGGGASADAAISWDRGRLAAVTVTGRDADAVRVVVTLSKLLPEIPFPRLEITPERGAAAIPEQTLEAMRQDDEGYVWSAGIRIASGLPAGTYTGTATLRLCKDAQCTSEYKLAGSTIPYRVQVLEARCTASETTFQGGYALENNVEANEHASSPYTGTDVVQCGAIAPTASGGVSAYLSASWPSPLSPLTLRGYPELVYGQKPWYDPVPGDDLPAKLSTLSHVNVHVDATQTEYTGYEGKLGFDLWLVSSTTPDAGGGMPIVGQLQLFTRTSAGVLPSGCPLVVVDGRSYTACTYPADTGRSWPLVIYYTTQQLVGGDYDLVPLIADYRARVNSAATDDSYLPSVEFGDQVFEGGVETPVNEFKVTVVKK